MNFFAVRLKRHPHLYVGKDSASYAFMCDQELVARMNNDKRHNRTVDETLQIDAHWFKCEDAANVWTSTRPVASLFNRSVNSFFDEDKPATITFNEYEIVHNGNVLTYEQFKAIKL
jgi:hypothetical protein